MLINARESRVKDLKADYQRFLGEFKAIKDQNKLFKNKIFDIGDEDFLTKFQNKAKNNDILISITSKDSGSNY